MEIRVRSPLNTIKYVLLMLVLTGVLAGCGATEETKVQLHYLSRSTPSIVTREYTLENTDRVDSIYEILEQLGTTQDDQELEPPLANGFSVLSVFVEDKVAVIDLDDGYTKLPADKEILIRASLVRSVVQVEGVDSVKLTIDGNKYNDITGQVIAEMNADSFVIGDDIVGDSANDIMVTLYFADSMGNGLKKIRRSMDFNDTDSMEELVIRQLIEGPGDNEGGAVINPKTKIKSVTVDGGICYVDLSKEFEEQPYNISTDVAIYSIVNTVTELNTVSHVRFLVEGNDEILYQGKYSFTEGFDRNIGMVTE